MSALLNIIRYQQNHHSASVKHYGFNSAFLVQSQTLKFKPGVWKSRSLFLLKYLSFPEGWLTHQNLESRRGDTKNTAIDLLLYLPFHPHLERKRHYASQKAHRSGNMGMQNLCMACKPSELHYNFMQSRELRVQSFVTTDFLE